MMHGYQFGGKGRDDQLKIKLKNGLALNQSFHKKKYKLFSTDSETQERSGWRGKKGRRGEGTPEHGRKEKGKGETRQNP